MKTKFCFGIAAALAVLVALPAASQSSRISSNTLGLFSNDADSFMDPNEYKTVEFDRWFSELQYARFQDLYRSYYNGSSDLLGAGYARYFGNTYLGFYFEGNVVEGHWYSGGGGKRINVYDRLDVLAGNDAFGGITGTLGVQYQNTGSSDRGGITIGAGWGRNFTLAGGSVLKPQIGLIYSRGFIPEGEPLLNVLEDTQTILAGLPFASSLDLNYTLAGGAEADWEFPVNGTIRPVISFGYGFACLGTDDFSPVGHVFSGLYKRTYDLSDQVSFGFGGGADIGFALGTVKSDNYDMDVTRFAFVPNALAGLTYQFKGPFSVNAGIGAEYPMGVWSAKTAPGLYKRTDNFMGPFEVHTHAGGTFQPTPNLALDFSFRAGGYYTITLDNLILGVRYRK